MSQAAIDRGLFRSTSLKTYKLAIQKNQSTSQDDIFIKPDRSQVAGMRQGSYDKVNEKGFAPEETRVENGDIIIGKVSPIQPVGNSGKVFKDSSEVYKAHIPGVIDKIYTDIFNSEGYEMRKGRTRSERIPHIGKFIAKKWILKYLLV
jgi:DNA-directed RNA polymerase II subunit RPB2